MTSSLLDNLRRRWLIRWVGLAFGASGLAGWAAALLLIRLSWPMVPAVTAAWTAALVTLAIMWLRRPPLTKGTVASHLNRSLHQAEESADLLVSQATDLGPLERLQRTRVAGYLGAIEPRMVQAPRRLYRTPIVAIVSAGSLGAAMWLWPVVGSAGEGDPSVAHVAPPPPPAIADATLNVQPPGYTGLSATTTNDWDVEFPEGSIVSWDVRVTNAPEGVWLETADGDSLALAPSSGSSGRFTLAITPAHSVVYRVVAIRGHAEVTGDYHTLVMRPDLPPTLTIVEPADRVTLAVADSWAVNLKVSARDDYGIAESEIVATIASGYGEGVQFIEIVKQFSGIRRTESALTLEERFELRELGMDSGDELYLYVRARDNRRPMANLARSETVIVAIEDTSTVIVSQPQGLAVDRMPDYFRSQRQIIIDTERLLDRRHDIDRETFNDRSQNIGLDQYLLRLRYSELVGDEFEDTPLGLVEQDLEDLGVESAAPAEPLPETPPAQEGEQEKEGLADRFLHEHDDPENATRLAATIKSTLKSALAEMWQAELRLRTHRPDEALPYERRALVFLKRVQQASRSYVLRTGFDPPPIDPKLSRLSGELEDVQRRTVTSRPRPAMPERDLRLALHVVQQIEVGAPVDSIAPMILEAGGRALARRVLAETSDYLEALGALRELTDSLKALSSCPHCIGPAARGLYRALPEPVSLRQATRPAESGLARAYLERLSEAP